VPRVKELNTDQLPGAVEIEYQPWAYPDVDVLGLGHVIPLFR
jgi:hypothetical protein